ncbi:tetratricopeptide repeat-containing glycosyltransferase family 2 protein [Clostridium sp. ZS2-4]|uniref:tetratricopeptide repeat-containing glycosyltransferase family 2 protein n=1 Tax=Clostridium sp. ZS2-4 TaxID=2987703 RepID=UPI00227D51CF|nr:TPR domain-containing glycosyltransferase [Clostridium sp. ZS2-4]MCY6353848.1 glycosyltransferase [Clostridium sp. ZS2-4]
MSNKISLCMIVKNEEKDLPRCLGSVKDLVDEMIIVDTGSTDKTVEIAKSYGAKVYYFKWCNNFSAARNESLKYATKDWILIMDADDELSSEDKDKFKALVNYNLNENTVCFFETLNYLGSAVNTSNITINLNPRVFKNNYGYCYEGEVHNQLVNHKHDFLGESYPIRIYHYGYLEQNLVSKDKRKRNITLLEKQIKEQPENKYAYFNLANEYFSIGDKKKALQNYYKAYEDFNPNTGYASNLIERIVLSNYDLKYYDKALEFIDIGTEYYPDFTNLYHIKGLVLNEQNKPTLAIKAFEKCIELGDPPPELKSIYGIGDFRSFYELSQIYLQLKDYDTAYKYCIETIKSNSEFLVPLYNIAHILKLKKTSLDEFKRIIENFFTDFPREYSIVADLFYREGYYETALEYIEKCEAGGMVIEDIEIFKVKCLIYSSKFDECIKYINNIPEDSLYYFQISMYKVICLITINNYDLALLTVNQFNDSNLSDNNKKTLQVYKELVNVFINKTVSILSEEENNKDFTSTIFEICEIFLVNKQFDKFEKVLSLLNLISDKSVLLQLGKLYYKYGYIDMAKKEIIRSIKLFEVMDAEGIDILKIS